jgi:DNA polymerase-3 subunit beta
MQFKIKKTEFLKGLRLAQSIADRKSTMPMLANVLLKLVGDSELLVIATDLNVSLSANLKSQNKGEGGITVGAKALHDIVTGMPGDDIEVKRADNNWAEISAGKVKYRLVGMPDRDFPKVPDHREAELTEVDAATLKGMIDSTLFSVSNDETRFHLNGVLFESDGDNSRMVSTDGHRLSKIDRDMQGAPKLTAGVIIPKKGLLEIKRTLDGVAGNCKLGIKTPYLYLEGGDIHLAVKLIESQFPPYEAVIPKTKEGEIEVDRSLFLDALKRAQLMSSETRGVKVSVSKNLLLISSDNPDIGEVKEEIEAKVEGIEVSVGFNPKYVVDILSQISTESILVELGGELDPVVIRPSGDMDYLGVVMPMRI